MKQGKLVEAERDYQAVVSHPPFTLSCIRALASRGIGEIYPLETNTPQNRDRDNVPPGERSVICNISECDHYNTITMSQYYLFKLCHHLVPSQFRSQDLFVISCECVSALHW